VTAPLPGWSWTPEPQRRTVCPPRLRFKPGLVADRAPASESTRCVRRPLLAGRHGRLSAGPYPGSHCRGLRCSGRASRRGGCHHQGPSHRTDGWFHSRPCTDDNLSCGPRRKAEACARAARCRGLTSERHCGGAVPPIACRYLTRASGFSDVGKLGLHQRLARLCLRVTSVSNRQYVQRGAPRCLCRHGGRQSRHVLVTCLPRVAHGNV
jgi:hypothetical protein